MTRRSESYRLVVQHIRSVRDERSVYRLVIYGGKRTFSPVDFESVDLLLRSLRAVVPEVQNEPGWMGLGEPGIVFTADVELTDSQLALLGLPTTDSDRLGT